MIGLTCFLSLLSIITIAYALASNIVGLGTVIILSVMAGAIVSIGTITYVARTLKREWHVLQCTEDKVYRMVYLPIPGTESDIHIGYWRKFDCQENLQDHELSEST